MVLLNLGRKRRWASFDILRGLAVLAVFVFHFTSVAAYAGCDSPFLSALTKVCGPVGPLGTNMFLLLSGLFVARNMCNPGWRYDRFVFRRLVRIYGPYVAAIVCALLFGQWFPSMTKPGIHDAGYLARNLALVPGIFPEDPLLTVTWVLPLVVAGYVLLPIGIMVARRFLQSPVHRLLFWLACWAVYVLVVAISGRGPLRACCLLVGCAVYAIFQIGDLPGRRKLLTRILVSGGIAGAATTFFVALAKAPQAWSPSLRSVIDMCAIAVFLTSMAGLAMISEVEGGDDLTLSSPNALQRLGAVGYSFYLWHGPVMKVVVRVSAKLFAGLPGGTWLHWATFPLCLFLALMVARLSFRFIEQPCDRWLKRLHAPSKEPRGLASAASA